METIAWISVYLVGYVVSYLYARHIMGKDWTVKVRTFVLMFSVLSWAVFIVAMVVGFFHILQKNLKNESKAKW